MTWLPTWFHPFCYSHSSWLRLSASSTSLLRRFAKCWKRETKLTWSSWARCIAAQRVVPEARWAHPRLCLGAQGTGCCWDRELHDAEVRYHAATFFSMQLYFHFMLFLCCRQRIKIWDSLGFDEPVEFEEGYTVIWGWFLSAIAFHNQELAAQGPSGGFQCLEPASVMLHPKYVPGPDARASVDIQISEPPAAFGCRPGDSVQRRGLSSAAVARRGQRWVGNRRRRRRQPSWRRVTRACRPALALWGQVWAVRVSVRC